MVLNNLGDQQSIEDERIARIYRQVLGDISLRIGRYRRPGAGDYRISRGLDDVSGANIPKGRKHSVGVDIKIGAQ